MIAALERGLTAVEAEAVLHALDSVTPYVRARATSANMPAEDLLSLVQDRLLRELHRFDPSHGSLPAFTQHLARWVVATARSRPVRERSDGLEPREPAATTATDPLRLLVARDEQTRWTGYVAEFISETDLAVLVQIASGTSRAELMDMFTLTEDGLARVRARVGAIALTVRQAMRHAAMGGPVTFASAAACVANFQGARTALPVLHAVGEAGSCPLADPGARRGPAAAAREQAAASLAAGTGVTRRVATDRVQAACRLLRVALHVIDRERGNS